jgi:hypothetical protein
MGLRPDPAGGPFTSGSAVPAIRSLKPRTLTAGAPGAVLGAQRVGQIPDPVSRMSDNQALWLPSVRAGRGQATLIDSEFRDTYQVSRSP